VTCLNGFNSKVCSIKFLAFLGLQLLECVKITHFIAKCQIAVPKKLYMYLKMKARIWKYLFNICTILSQCF